MDAKLESSRDQAWATMRERQADLQCLVDDWGKPPTCPTEASYNEQTKYLACRLVLGKLKARRAGYVI